MHHRRFILGIVLTLGVSATGIAGPSASAPLPTGHLRLTFAERSPLSATDTVLQRFDLNSQPDGTRESLEYDLAKLSFEVLIPPSYEADVPHGLLIWMGAADFSPTWLDSLSRHKLILVVANTTRGRVALYGPPLDIVHNMKKLYSIDENRVYVSGFSAGGQAATMMLRAFPDVFHGGLFLMGGCFYLSRIDETGRREPTIKGPSPKWKGPLDQIKRTVKIVMVKGGSDPEWTAQEGRCDYKALSLDGFIHVSYIEVPGLGHRPPDASWFEKGVAALDESKPLTPPVVRPTKEPNPLPGQIAQAQRILAAARFYLEQMPSDKLSESVKEKIRRSNRDTSLKYLQRVLNEYPTTPAAAQAHDLLRAMGRDITGQDAP
jgi:hypothetical protein